MKVEVMEVDKITEEEYVWPENRGKDGMLEKS